MNFPLPIDLRSDTVTRPTPGMRQAMARADVGDDVLGDDPTVEHLQEQVAQLLGKPAALFMPSGTMANQTAIRAHTAPGDEIIGDIDGHFYNYESAAFAALSGCSLRPLQGQKGVFTSQQVEAAVRPPDHHFARSRLVIVENTHNRGGGTIWPVQSAADVRQVAVRRNLLVHLDGARLLNACVATGRKPTDWAQHADSVSICFSKGLGAPIGSAVAGDEEFIERVHRFRKMFGGGMRQVGIIAAAAIYALEHHVDRLAEDHANARRLAEALAEMPGILLDPAGVQTNIIIFDLDDRLPEAPELVQRFRDQGVWMLPTAPRRVRAVTHLDLRSEQIDEAIARVGGVLRAVAR